MNTRKFVVLSAIVVILCISIIGFILPLLAGDDMLKIESGKYYEVDRVIDGDTFSVKDGRKHANVRMLGIDTPETKDPRKPEQCYGHQAWEETKKLIEGLRVKIVFNPNRELKDKYRRYLGYVYREDGLFVNESLLINGFARNYEFGKKHSSSTQFASIEKDSMNEKRGLWGVCQ